MKYGDKPVPGSPFRVRAGPPYDASKVKVSGPGVEKAGIVAEEITKAVVDTTEAGIADLSGWLNMVKLVEESDESSFHTLLSERLSAISDYDQLLVVYDAHDYRIRLRLHFNVHSFLL